MPTQTLDAISGSTAFAGVNADAGPFEQVLAAALDRSDNVPCMTVDPETFFAEETEGIEFAKSLCATCAVRTACLAAARQRREPWGVWGGELFERGVVIPRKRQRGRPRKEAAQDPDKEFCAA